MPLILPSLANAIREERGKVLEKVLLFFSWVRKRMVIMEEEKQVVDHGELLIAIDAEV